MQYLKGAKEFVTSMGYQISDTIKDSEGYPFAYKVMLNGREYYLLAAKGFYYRKDIGICKSIDKALIERAWKDRIDILLYIHSPSMNYEEHLPVCYSIITDNIYAIKNTLMEEPFSKYGQKRFKYLIPLLKVGIRNIRSDLARKMNEGEKFWNQHLKGLGFIYIGDQHGNPIYKENIGFCPDFIHLGTNHIVEEGWHDKNEMNRRKALAEQHNMILYFIPYNFKHYRRNPEAAQGVINKIKELIQCG